MKDRTLVYTEALLKEEGKRREARSAIERRLRLYRESNPRLGSLLSMDACLGEYCGCFLGAKKSAKDRGLGLAGLLKYAVCNYLEERICEYSGSTACAGCGETSYFCGVNCKTCGLWQCTGCIRVHQDVPLCEKCRAVLSDKACGNPPANRRCLDRISGSYELIKRCMKNPDLSLISELSEHISRYEEGGMCPEFAEMERNIRIQMKRCICLWYIYKTREEFAHILLEQIRYLEGLLGKANEQSRGAISSSIQELLAELARANSA